LLQLNRTLQHLCLACFSFLEGTIRVGRSRGKNSCRIGSHRRSTGGITAGAVSGNSCLSFGTVSGVNDFQVEVNPASQRRRLCQYTSSSNTSQGTPACLAG
jgi:hypothetical protein